MSVEAVPGGEPHDLVAKQGMGTMLARHPGEPSVRYPFVKVTCSKCGEKIGFVRETLDSARERIPGVFRERIPACNVVPQ